MPVPFLPSPPASLLPYRLSVVPAPLWVARSHRLASTACPWPPLRAARCVHVLVIVFVVVCFVMMFHVTISCLKISVFLYSCVTRLHPVFGLRLLRARRWWISQCVSMMESPSRPLCAVSKSHARARATLWSSRGGGVCVSRHIHV